MKSKWFLIFVMVSCFSFAQGSAPTGQEAQSGDEAIQRNPDASKMSYKAARKKCLSGNRKLKGKRLKKCIRRLMRSGK
jgi:hypothetical protein